MSKITVPITLTPTQFQDLITVCRITRGAMTGKKAYQETLMLLEDQIYDAAYGRRRSLGEWILRKVK